MNLIDAKWWIERADLCPESTQNMAFSLRDFGYKAQTERNDNYCSIMEREHTATHGLF